MILTNDQETILSTLASQPIAKKFYWTGGTLLASYYLHHRKSFDLDFFSDKPFGRDELTPFIDAVKRALDAPDIAESKIYDRWEFVVATRKDESAQLRFEFVHYNHQKHQLADRKTYKGLVVDSLDDLAANKTMAYFDRNQPKDLLDVYTLLTKGPYTVEKLLAMVTRKFGPKYSEFLFWSESAKSLRNLDSLRVYFLETDPAKQNELLTRIKYYFLDHGKEYLARHLE